VTLVAGIDSSTQSCKVVVRDLASGAILRKGSAPHPAGTEVDPEAWWDALQSAMSSAGGIDDVAAISISAQQHGLVALDDRGNVIRPSLLWNDTRSAPAAAQLIKEFGAAALAARSGSVPVASFTITKLRWLRDAEPENAARVAAVALPHDWLTWRIRGFGPSGESPLGPDFSELVTDRSDASGTGYFDSLTSTYDDELLTAALGHSAHLPRVLRAEERAGLTAEGIVVGAGAGDNAAAALGLNARQGDAVLSIGTSGTVFAVSTMASRDETGTVAGFADASGHFLPLVATLNAARVLKASADLLGVGFDDFASIALQAKSGAGGVVLLPYFEGERTPNLPSAKASLHGLSLSSYSRENIARASVEGMLCGLADGLDALENHSSTVSRLMIIGGGAQSQAVQKIATTVFNVPLVVPAVAEYVALGSTVQAAWALTDERPEWDVEEQRTLTSDVNPTLRSQYSHVQAASLRE
jgi:xylulokinase